MTPKAAQPAKTVEELTAELLALANPANLEGQRRFGMTGSNQLGISIPNLRAMARGQRSHTLAQQLWDTGYHEARILAGFVDDPKQVTREQMERWVLDFDSWDLCDQVCMSLFSETSFVKEYIYAWCEREEEFVRRAGFALIAVCAWHKKDWPDSEFIPFLDLALKYSDDKRNFVKKAVNWALRQVGKRNPILCAAATDTANRMLELSSPSAHWIASDALREFAAKAAKSAPEE